MSRQQLIWASRICAFPPFKNNRKVACVRNSFSGIISEFYILTGLLIFHHAFVLVCRVFNMVWMNVSMGAVNGSKVVENRHTYILKQFLVVHWLINY